MSRRKRGRMDPPEDSLVIGSASADEEDKVEYDPGTGDACLRIASDQSPGRVTTRRMTRKRRLGERFSQILHHLAERAEAAKKLKEIERGEEDSVIKKPTNPMTVSLVVNEVMSYLDPTTLKACRLVSRQWNETAIPHFRASYPPITLTKSAKIFKFHELLKTSKIIPFESFKVATRYTPRIDKYLSSFGNSIRCLQILSWPGKKMTSFHQLFELLKSMPLLKKLMVTNVDFPVREEGVPKAPHAKLNSPAPVNLPFLETLTFTGWFMPRANIMPLSRPLDMEAQQCIVDLYNSAPQTRFMELNILRASIVQNFMVGLSRLKKLESLTVHNVSESDLRHLVRSSSDLPFLRSMTFREVHLTNHGGDLLKLLETYGERLENLGIRVLTTRDVQIVKFPRMPSLKTLTLDTFFTLDQFVMDTPNIPEETPDPFPILRKMTVSLNVLQGMILTKLSSPAVQELVIHMPPNVVRGYRNSIQDDNDPPDHPLHDRSQANAVKEVPTVFPSLKTLRVIDPRCSVIRTIFQHLTHIEELEICHSKQDYVVNATVDLNRVLTGMDHPALLSGMLQLYGSHPGVSREKMDVALEFVHTCSPVSIRTMTNLKTLILSGHQCIDEATVVLALLYIQPLDRLIFSAKSKCFGTRTLEKLRKRHRMVQVKPVPPVQPDLYNDITL